jgi:CRP/FNR family cyclic AMP-dependent transcriptional regulator
MLLNAQNLDISSLAQTLGEPLHHKAGAIIFREDAPCEGVFVVLGGSVELSRHGHLIQTVEKGGALGILSVLDGDKLSATAKASTDVDLAFIDARKFRYAVEEVPNFVWYVMSALVERLRATNAAI